MKFNLAMNAQTVQTTPTEYTHSQNTTLGSLNSQPLNKVLSWKYVLSIPKGIYLIVHKMKYLFSYNFVNGLFQALLAFG